MTEGFTVRTAGPDDVQVIHDLLLEFNGEALAPGALAGRMDQTKGLETVLACEWEAKPVGLLILRIVPTLSGPMDWAELTEMYVQPAFRRRGAGTALVTAAVAHCRTHGCTEVHLLVGPENRAAHAFYQAMGFGRDSCEMWRRL